MLSERTNRQEQRLREQLNEGCRLARELDERVRSIPAGKLAGGGDHSDQAASSSSSSSGLRCSIAIATADVVAAFNEAIKLLLQSSCTADHSATVSAASSPPQALYSSPQRKTSTGRRAINLAVEQQCPGSVQMKSPPISPRTRPAAAPSHHTAHRQQGNTATPSPPRTIHSPLLSATSEMSDDSSKANLDLPADEPTTAINPLPAVICKKRKLLPRVALKMPAGSAETAESNTPPDDGHTWRKYGQKVILGAHYPRSYYRCTHKMDLGCPALKQVQRCDEDRSFFDVIYQGSHTCRSAELDRECWPLAFPQGLSNFLNLPNYSRISPSAITSIPPAAACARQISAAHGDQHPCLDNLLAHKFRHVVSTTSSSAALPFNCNADLSMSQAFMASSAKLPASAADCSSYVPLHQYNTLSSARSLVAVSSGAAPSNAGSAYLNPPFNDSSAPTQDRRSSNKDHPKGTADYYVGEDYQQGQAMYGSLMLKPPGPSNMQVVAAQGAQPSPLTRSNQQVLQQQNDAGASALAFDTTMDNDDLLLVYLDQPSL